MSAERCYTVIVMLLALQGLSLVMIYLKNAEIKRLRSPKTIRFPARRAAESGTGSTRGPQ